MSKNSKLLKLLAFDQDDLAVVSAHLQDAVLKVADLTFQPSAKRFVMVLNRFDWAGAAPGAANFDRLQAALRFEGVRRAQFQNIRLDARSEILSLLAVNFEEKDPPGGVLTLMFAGGAAIRLEIEFIEAELRDLGPVWRTQKKPDHDGETSQAPSTPNRQNVGDDPY